MNAVPVVRDLLRASIQKRVDGRFFASQLESRELDRRLAFIGAAHFDPDGFVRACIAARDFLEFADERCEHCDGAPAIGTLDECQWCDGTGLKPEYRQGAGRERA